MSETPAPPTAAPPPRIEPLTAEELAAMRERLYGSLGRHTIADRCLAEGRCVGCLEAVCDCPPDERLTAEQWRAKLAGIDIALRREADLSDVGRLIAALEAVTAERDEARRKRDAARAESKNEGLRAFEMETEHAGCAAALHLARTAAASAALRIGQLEGTLSKINDIRNSIVGCQTVNFSAHVYPLVAALEEAGIAGDGYDVARPKAVTLVARATLAEGRAERLAASLKLALEWGCKDVPALMAEVSGDDEEDCDWLGEPEWFAAARAALSEGGAEEPAPTTEEEKP